MKIFDENYIDGRWEPSTGKEQVDLVNPATEEVIGKINLSPATDVDRAARAARAAFASFSRTTVEERIALIERIAEGLQARSDELAQAISDEMGCARWLASTGQTQLAIAHLTVAAQALKSFEFDRPMGSTMVRMVPIGVAALITPWNFPASTITCKIAPALATGCTMILKPSEYSPISARIIAEVMDAAGTPPGVFNMVYGNGETVGEALSGHPEVDLVSITGSTRAGIAVAQNAARTVKRVHQELGGKSPNIILPSANIQDAVARGVRMMMLNAGQGCSLPSRMLVPADRMAEVRDAVLRTEAEVQPGLPDSNAYMGPVVNGSQFTRIQAYIESGLAEGATAIIGGPGRPEGLDRGYYVKPTVFADNRPDMKIVREEIFGPVLVVQSYQTEEEAIALANDTPYGLAGYVEAGSTEEAAAMGDRIAAGQIILNGAGVDMAAPFGGFGQSGNGREWGPYAFEAFLEVKAMVGYAPVTAGTGSPFAALPAV